MCNVWTHSPVAIRQTRIVSSLELDATKTESCEKTTESTQLPWPSNVWTHSPVAVRQTRIVLSEEPDATSAESCEKITDVMTSS